MAIKEQQIVEVNVGTIDNGRAIETMNEELAKVINDVMVRKLIEKKRSVTLQIEIEPNIDPTTEENRPYISWAVKHSVPGKSGKKSMAFIKDGKLKILSRATGQQMALFSPENLAAMEAERLNQDGQD